MENQRYATVAQYLMDNFYYFTDVPEDSNSLYTAVKHSLIFVCPVFAESTVQKLREYAATEIEDEYERYMYLNPENLSREETAHRIRHGDYHAAELEIAALARGLNIRIEIMFEDGSTTLYPAYSLHMPIIKVKKVGRYYKGVIALPVFIVVDFLIAGLAFYWPYLNAFF